MLKMNKSSKGKRVILTVNVDAFGNAVPDVPSMSGAAKAQRVVGQREVITMVKTDSKSLGSIARDLLSRALNDKSNALVSKSASTTLVERQSAGQPQAIPSESVHFATIQARLEHAFSSLHQEFNRREEQLEQHLHLIKAQQEVALQSSAKTKPRNWALPLVLAGSVAGGYMLYVLTSMQHSMTVMTSNITAMNGHMGTMSQNVQTMNGSMANLNGNVAYMNQSVATMNQQIGTLSRAAAPMGEMASGMRPFTKMFSKFMPF